MNRNEWTYKKLGEVCSFHRGLTYSGKDEVPFSKNVVLRSNNIDLGTNTINFDELKYISEDITIPDEKKLKSNSIFMCMSNGSKQHLGKVAFIDKDYDYAFGGFMGLIKPFASSIFPKFIYYYFCSNKFKNFIATIGNGANINNIKFSDIGGNGLNIPLRETQIQIVSELDNINDSIAMLKQQVNDLDSISHSLFYEMFGDPETNEKGWQIETLKNQIKIVGGYAFKSDAFVDEGIPVLRIGNVNSGKFKPDNLVYWKKDSKLARYLILPGELVMSLTGTVGKSDYGNVCILDDSFQEYYLNQRNAKLEITGNINKIYLAEILRFDSVKSRLTRISRGVRQANISNKDIESLKIPVPPLSLQESFASKICSLDEVKLSLNSQIVELQNVLNCRMQYWFD